MKGESVSPFESYADLYLEGGEEIVTGATVSDFWRWALGDLRLNSTRGMLAQFLVARAVGDARRTDDGWGPFDVLAADGTKIEVKSSAYLQNWYQERHSRISFSGLITTRWDSQTNTFDNEPGVIADVYVFAVNTCKDRALYDPLDVTLWEFYVLEANVIREKNQKSMALSTVQRLSGGPVQWSDLKRAIGLASAK